MNEEVTRSELYQKIGRIDARLDNVEDQIDRLDGKLDTRLAAVNEKIDARVGEINLAMNKVFALLNQGRGAWWALTKILIVLGAAAGAVAWAWEYIGKILPRP